MRRPRFTPVPHELIDEHLLEMSGPEVKVLLVILRKSHGWNRETETISLSQLSKIAGISTSTCSDSVKALVDRGLVKKTTNSTTENGHCASTYEPCFEDDPPSRPSEEATRSSEDPSRPSEEYKEERKEAKERKEYYSSPTPSLEENPPEPEPRAKPFFEQFYRAHKRGGGKVDWNAKAEHNAWLMEQSETDEAILSALDRFLADAYWRKGNHPLAMFRRNFARYLEAEDPTVDQELSLISFRAAYDSTGAVSIQSDWDKARVIWLTLTESDRSKASSRVVEYDPAFIKSPRNYLRDREFDRPPRPAPKSNLEKLMEMA